MREENRSSCIPGVDQVVTVCTLVILFLSSLQSEFMVFETFWNFYSLKLSPLRPFVILEFLLMTHRWLQDVFDVPLTIMLTDDEKYIFSEKRTI